MEEVLSSLAINAIYDLIKSGFNKAYSNVKLVLQNKNVDEDTIKLVYTAIEDKNKDSFLNIEELDKYLNEYFRSKKTNTIQNSPNSIIVTESQNTNIRYYVANEPTPISLQFSS